jgi:phage terminase small subunit
MIGKAMALTDKQTRFIAEYLIDSNATKAAIRAGYSEKTAKEIGCENLTKPNIAAEIAKRQEKLADKLEITAEYVLGGIKNLVERCIQAEPVLDREGNETGEYKFEAFAALKGYELLGKHKKLFIDRKEVSGPDGGPIEVTDARDKLIGKLTG